MCVPDVTGTLDCGFRTQKKIKKIITTEYLSHNFDEQCLGGHWAYLMPFLPQWGGTIDPCVLRFLVVRDIDCGNWLARGYMPAHQHCDLFYPLGWGSDWVYHKLGNAPVLRSGTGSWVLSGQSGVRHPLSPVIRLGLRNPRKQEIMPRS